MSGTTYYQRNREAILNRAKDYYRNNRCFITNKVNSYAICGVSQLVSLRVQ